MTNLAIYVAVFLLLILIRFLGYKDKIPILPGDVILKKLNMDIYLPFITSALISVLIIVTKDLL